MKHVSPLAFTLALTTLVVGCGSTDPTKAPATTAEPATNACGLSTKYLGDDNCILPPTAEEGIQLHVGPSSYDDPVALEPYLLAGGDENVRCFNTTLPEGDFHYLKQQNRMRPSSHHMLINLSSDTTLTEGPTSVCDLANNSVGSIPGSQVPSRDFPSELGPEDAGLARYLPKAAMATFQLHYVNLGTDPVLREAWINLYKTPESEVKQSLQSIFLVGDLGVDVKPQSRATTTLQYSPTLPGQTRIFEINGHMHAHAETFTIWRLHGGQKDQIYESFNWEEPKELTLNTVVQNPLPDSTTLTDGGSSGLLYLQPGDTLQWACDVNNTTDADLRFDNQAHTAEMCLLAGAYISPTPGLMTGFCINGSCRDGAAKPTG